MTASQNHCAGIGECKYVLDRQTLLKQNAIQDSHALEQMEAKRASERAKITARQDVLRRSIQANELKRTKLTNQQNGLLVEIAQKKSVPTNLDTDLESLSSWKKRHEAPDQYAKLQGQITAMDVVPAAWAGFSAQHKRPLYLIPDGNGRWMESNPEIHNGYIAEANQQSRGKLRAVAQLFKFWRGCRNATIPISSFHIEMVLASEGVCTGVKSYAECMTELLQKMAERDCVGIRDPKGISGNIAAIKSEAQRAAVLASVKTSRDYAKAALSAERNGRMSEALQQWNYAFNYEFLK